MLNLFKKKQQTEVKPKRTEYQEMAIKQRWNTRKDMRKKREILKCNLYIVNRDKHANEVNIREPIVGYHDAMLNVMTSGCSTYYNIGSEAMVTSAEICGDGGC